MVGSSNTVAIMRFSNTTAAHLAKATLQNQGIAAQVVGDELSDTLSYYGPAVNRIDLLTLERDADRALGVLQAMADEEAARTGAWGDGKLEWLCDCGEQNAMSFDECWKCGTGRSGQPTLVLEINDEDTPPTIDGSNTVPVNDLNCDSPYRPPRVETRDLTYSAEAISLKSDDRIAQMGVFGAFLPPLAFYGVYLSFCTVFSGQATAKTALAFSGCFLIAFLWVAFIFIFAATP